MKFSEKWRPASLDEIVGQPGVREVAGFLRAPYSSCWLFEGPGGTGKTTLAFNVGKALGADEGWPGLLYYQGGKFGRDDADEMIRFLKCGMCCPKREHFHLAIVEELEWLSDQCIRYLKSALEVEVGERAIVIATSNSVAPIEAKDMWFLQRFSRVKFAGDESFATAGNARVVDVATEQLIMLPDNWEQWGWAGENGTRSYSLRLALDRLQQFSLRLPADVPTGDQITF